MQAWIVDTFADEQYAGNPAGVISHPDGFLSTERMQAIAFDLGVPTTAFVVPGEAGQFRIRWFTPEKELNICGHATIAAAAYLYEVERISPSTELRFRAPFDSLYARRQGGLISLQLPRMDISPCAVPDGLAQALGAEIVYCGRAIDDIVLEVESESVVANLCPDFARMRGIDCRGHLVTARSDREDADFVLRSFFPAYGVNEDQVCVSAQCKLGPYWAERLGKRRLEVVQLSERGGRLLLRVTGTSVHVSATAVVRQRAVPPVAAGVA